MDGWRCYIPEKLPSLNDYIRTCRGNKYAAAKEKAEIEEKLAWYIRRCPRFDGPVEITFTWAEGNRRRDYDNVAFAKKFVLDALVKYGCLPDDNRNFVTAFRDEFVYEKEFGLYLEIRRKG